VPTSYETVRGRTIGEDTLAVFPGLSVVVVVVMVAMDCDTGYDGETLVCRQQIDLVYAEVGWGVAWMSVGAGKGGPGGQRAV
jgi:hypothetical protein